MKPHSYYLGTSPHSSLNFHKHKKASRRILLQAFQWKYAHKPNYFPARQLRGGLTINHKASEEELLLKRRYMWGK